MILQMEIGGRRREVLVERLESGNRFRFTIDGRALELSAVRVEPGTWSLLLPDGSHHLVAVSGTAASGFRVHLPSGDVSVALSERGRGRRREPIDAGRTSGSGPARIVAPMPGKVARVLVAEGQSVHAGQGIVVVEAMKMENELRSPRDGVLKAVPVREGASVEAGALLAVIE